MKKFLISSFTFIVAMLPLSILSSSNDNVNSADVNHDGEVNISDVNAVIDIILGGAHEGYSGDVNNDGETNISDINYIIDIILGKQITAVPVINTQIVDNGVIITAAGNGNVCLYVNGLMVTNPYVAIRGEVDYVITVYATAKEDGKLMSRCEAINVLIPAMPITATPEIITDITEDAVIILATGGGVVKLYVNDSLVENPYTALRSDMDYELTIYATAQEEGKALSQSDNQCIIIPALDKNEEHEWVDLGLPSGTLWATCNLGASSPEEYGDYFAWGETSPKNEYSWNTYKWCNGSENTLTKYCTDSSYGTVDNKTELEPEDDAAYVNWGPLWRMPSYDQQTELRTKCTWTWTTLNGVRGNLVTGPNGASLFLPATGYHWDSSFDYSGNYGWYWSNTLGSGSPYGAWDQSFCNGTVGWERGYRRNGMTVRPVHVSQN
ncbi:MAG: hypothetical protein IKW97_08030 [Muribaculaceae bacterium]|nr:hypothetical protein [Muribaculaceae bacterium]